MRERYEPDAAVTRLAAHQDGVLSRAQALELGVPRGSLERLVAEGRWRIPMRGVLITHDQPCGWRSLAWVGLLAAGDRSRLGGYAAAFVQGLVDEPPSVITVLTPHEKQLRSRERWSFVRERPGVRDPRSPGSPPRTTIEDTVLDLSAGGFHDGPVASPMHWLSTAVQRRLTTAARLRRTLAVRARIPRRREIEALLADVAEGAQSPLEIRYLNDVERAHGLPRASRQVVARKRGRTAVRDVRYDEYGVLVELDGRLGHAGQGRFRDFRRDNAALLDGEVTLRYGWHDVTGTACAVAAEVAELLIRGGWTGSPHRCRACSSLGGSRP